MEYCWIHRRAGIAHVLSFQYSHVIYFLENPLRVACLQTNLLGAIVLEKLIWGSEETSLKPADFISFSFVGGCPSIREDASIISQFGERSDQQTYINNTYGSRWIQSLSESLVLFLLRIHRFFSKHVKLSYCSHFSQCSKVWHCVFNLGFSALWGKKVLESYIILSHISILLVSEIVI